MNNHNRNDKIRVLEAARCSAEESYSEASAGHVRSGPRRTEWLTPGLHNKIPA